MTPNHSGGSATSARPLATSSDSSAVAVLRLSVGDEGGIEWNLSGELGEDSGDLRAPGSGAPVPAVPATPSPIADQDFPRREERS